MKPSHQGGRGCWGRGRAWSVAALSALGRTAKVLHAEQLLLRWPEVLSIVSSYRFSRRARDDVPVPEIVHQQSVVRVEQTSTTRDGERDDVFIIGGAETCPPDSPLLSGDFLIPDLQQPTGQLVLLEPFPEATVSFSSANNRPPTANRPFPSPSQRRKRFPRLRRVTAKHLVGHVVVDYCSTSVIQ